MRKRLLGITVFAAALTLSTGITAFAGTWKEDTHGRYYENDDGSRPVYAGWFTDPDDGAVYGMDPDGYVMVNSDMGTFRTDDQGRRIEKTEEDLQREAERRAEIASRPSPAKKAAAADIAADAAKASAAAASTTRSSYQAEMKVFMEKLFNDAKAKRTDTTILADGSEDNTEMTYGFKNPDGYRFISASIWKTAKPTAANYKDHAFEMSYHFDSAVSDRTIYDDIYNQLTIAALGESEGAAVLGYIQSERDGGSSSFDRAGSTDTGNTYTVSYRNGLATISVVCSEYEPEAENADESSAAGAEADTAQDTPAVTTSVVVAGGAAASNTADSANNADEANSADEADNNDETETEAAAE